MIFANGARRLSGLAGLLFGWTPETFWSATPAELSALLDATTNNGPSDDPPDSALIERMMEAFPDG